MTTSEHNSSEIGFIIGIEIRLEWSHIQYNQIISFVEGDLPRK